MKNLILIFFYVFVFGLTSCWKDEQRLITGAWYFAEKPHQNLNHYMGFIEDRTVFNGSEELIFDRRGDFYIDSTKYGTWNLDNHQTNIIINITFKNGYPPNGYSLNYFDFEIIKINKSILEVNHRYYKYNENKYKLRKK